MTKIRDDSKRREHRDIQFSQRLDDITAMLKRLHDRDRVAQEGMVATYNGTCSGVSSVSEPTEGTDKVVIHELNNQRSPESVRIHEELVAYLWNQQHSPKSREWMDRGSPDLSMESKTLQEDFCTAIIETLSFETIKWREQAILKPFEKTFSWVVFRQPEEFNGNQLWSSFPEWLEGSTNQPYWITGKPGSGKSTLMKFILQHPSIKIHLPKWAGDFDVIVTSYYAWVAGADLQRSCEGLQRTLLYQILKLNPSLIPEVAPRRWSLLCTLRSVVNMPPWKRWEIEESFEILLSQSERTLRLALFIDGLDEFDSPPLEVLNLIHKMSLRNGIKICVASRQWTEFNDAFRQNPMLRMQDLTTADMAHFVQAKLEGNRGFVELKRIFPIEATCLISDVVSKANGVFLWVSLVVTSLLEGLTEGDRLLELQATMKQLPSDIAELYDAIWSRIRDRNIVASSKLLVTFKAAKEPLSHLNLWLADETDESKKLDFDMNSITADGRASITEIMHRRLDSRTRGILEISHNGMVDFLHRTARDWTLQPAVWHRICSTIPEGFDPYLSLLKAETLRSTDKKYGLGRSLDSVWHYINKTLWYASQVGDFPGNHPTLVQILDKLNNQVEKIAAPFVQTTISNHQLHMDGWHWRRQGVQIRLHWSSTQELKTGYNSPYKSGYKSGIQPNTFLGLTAQFCVLPYLQAKLSPNEKASQHRIPHGHFTLLENAIFGCDATMESAPILDIFFIEPRKRLQTVVFLLERGASPKQKRLGGTLMLNEIRILKARDTFKASDSSNYWAQVDELMNQTLSERRNLKSMLRLTKGQ